MTARGVLADAYRLAAYVANQFGARDLAYAAIGHSADQARAGGDPVREASVASGRSWIYLRDARTDDAEHTAALSYSSIEPTYSDRDSVRLATYGWHVTFAAAVAARQGSTAAADDLLSQGATDGAERAVVEKALGDVDCPRESVDHIRDLARRHGIDARIRADIRRHAQTATAEAAAWTPHWRTEAVSFFTHLPHVVAHTVQ